MLLVAVLVIINNFLCQPSLFVHFGEDLFTTIPNPIVRMQLSNWKDMRCQNQKRKEMIFGIEIMQYTNKRFFEFFLYDLWYLNILKYQIICSPPERQPWQQSYYDDGVKMTKMERQATLSTGAQSLSSTGALCTNNRTLLWNMCHWFTRNTLYICV